MRHLVFAAFVAASLSACAQTATTDQSSAATSATAGPADSSGSADASSAPVDPNSPDYVSAPGRPARCFMTDQVRNFRADGTSRVFLRTNRQDVFEVTLFAGCRNIGTGMSLQISGQMPWIRNMCVGDRANISSRTSSNRACQGRVLRSLTPEQVEALPGRLRP